MRIDKMKHFFRLPGKEYVIKTSKKYLLILIISVFISMFFMKNLQPVLIVAKYNVNVLFIVLILYSPIVLIEADCNTDISISNFKFLYIFLIIFSFFQLSGIIYKTQFTIGVEINENYKI